MEQIQLDANAVDRWSFEDVVEKRSISRVLLKMLIADSEYRLGAEMVAGIAELFGGYREKLEHAVHQSTNLESLIITCRSEISYHQKWSESVLGSLPDHDGTAVLRAAFVRANEAGARLVQDLESATVKDQEAPANASSH